MIRRSDPLRRALSGVIAILTLGLSVAMPVLERGSFGALSVESHHDSSRCSPGHDHRLCAQVGANLAAVPVESHRLPDDFVVRSAPPAGESLAPAGSALTGTRSRAPPSD